MSFLWLNMLKWKTCFIKLILIPHCFLRIFSQARFWNTLSPQLLLSVWTWLSSDFLRLNFSSSTQNTLCCLTDQPTEANTSIGWRCGSVAGGERVREWGKEGEREGERRSGGGVSRLLSGGGVPDCNEVTGLIRGDFSHNQPPQNTFSESRGGEEVPAAWLLFPH